MALVTVVLSFATLFSDMGLNSAYLQKRDVDNEQRSSLFWANIAFSIILGLIVVSISSTVATYFGDMRLTLLIDLSAAVLILASFGLQLRTTAQKDLKFRSLALLETASLLIGFAVSVTLAILGFGVYSLIWGGISSALAGSLLSWVFISNGWKPLFRFKFSDLRSFWGFGGAVVGNNVVNQVNLTIDVLLGGRILGADQLGIYSVSRNLVMQLQFLINPIATKVGFPLIAKLQNDVENRSLVYLKTMNLTTSLNAPVYVGIAVFSEEVVQFLFGEEWSDAASVLSVLAIWGLFRSFGNPVGSLLLGTGNASLALKWNVMVLFALVIILWFAADYGIEGLAWSLLCFQIFAFVPSWSILVRPLTNITLFDYCMVLFRPIFCAVMAVSLVSISMSHVASSMILQLILVVMCSGLLYLPLSYLFNRGAVDSFIQLVFSDGRSRKA